MSDYEVTLVNDNSKAYMDHSTRCSRANCYLVYVLVVQIYVGEVA